MQPNRADLPRVVDHCILSRAVLVTRDAISRKWMSKKPDRKSALLEEDVLIIGNESANDSDASDAPCCRWAMCDAVFWGEGVCL